MSEMYSCNATWGEIMSTLSNCLKIIWSDEYDPEYVDFSADIEDIEFQIRSLRTEVDCRIEHGANSNGHLEYVRNRLDRILE